MSDLYAVLDPANPAYGRWFRDLGCDFVPVVAGGPVEVRYEDQPDTPVAVYWVDLDRMTAQQLVAVVGRTAAEHNVPFEELLAEFRAEGLPVAAASVVVCEDPAGGRLRFPFWRRGEVPLG